MSFRATRLIALLTRAAARAPTTALRPLLSTRVTPSTTLQNLKPPSLAIPQTNAQVRTYAIGATSGKSQADLLVDELQELYVPTPTPTPSQTQPRKLIQVEWQIRSRQRRIRNRNRQHRQRHHLRRLRPRLLPRRPQPAPRHVLAVHVFGDALERGIAPAAAGAAG